MKIVIFGAGENGIQAYHILRRAETHEVVAFVDDGPRGERAQLCGLRVPTIEAALGEN